MSRPLVAVTDHAAERFRQRVGSTRGALDVKPEVATRVADAVEAGRSTTTPPAGSEGTPGSVYVARPARARRRLRVPARGARAARHHAVGGRVRARGSRVPRHFTDALRESDRAVRDWEQRERDRYSD